MIIQNGAETLQLYLTYAIKGSRFRDIV